MLENKNIRDTKIHKVFPAIVFLIAFALFSVSSNAQTPKETPPPPGKPSSVEIPDVKESKLKNDLPVAVVERNKLPLVTVRLLIKSGANRESPELAGLADMTAELLTKGTKTRTATQIAEELEFLGGSINSGSDWNSTMITVNVMSDKVDEALAIMADAVLNPTFSQDEIDLYKSQVLDNLSVSLKQPGTLGRYVATRYSFKEHVSSGTPETITAIKKEDIAAFHKKFYKPWDSVLIFTGDISAKKAAELGAKYFENWKPAKSKMVKSKAFKKVDVKTSTSLKDKKDADVIRRILVIDLPNSGQASVSFATKENFGRKDADNYYSSSVLNSLLGGGYSARLNQEIRIKRGLSYGARSDFDYRMDKTNFIATTQTKNESAAEVADLIRIEIEKLLNEDISKDELTPRQAVLTGGFGRRLETNNGLAGLISELYLFGLDTAELNNYMGDVQKVSGEKIKTFAVNNLGFGDLVIVGDASVFMDELKKKFPQQPIDIISVEELDLNRDNLRKVSDKKAKPKAKRSKEAPKARIKSDADRNDN